MRVPPVTSQLPGSSATSKPSVAAVAADNEFGVRHDGGGPPIPERPFFRRGLIAAEDPILDVLKGGIDPDKMVVDVRTAEAVGLVIQSAIQREIETSESWAVPNSPATIEAKGSSGPLRDTGLLRNSITYKVES